MTTPSVAHDMKDWPRPLRLSASAADLAQTIYRTAREGYGLPVHPWVDLPWHLRQALLEVAIRTLRQVSPASWHSPTTSDTFAERLYQFGTELAKAEAARLMEERGQ